MSKRSWAVLAAIAAGLMLPAAGVSKSTGGTLNMIAWEGYTQPQWVTPFEKQSGCTVHAKYAGSSDEMVTLMRSGGGGQYDMVSDRKSTRLNSSHSQQSRMPSSA